MTALVWTPRLSGPKTAWIDSARRFGRDPGAADRDRFVAAWPGRHGHGDGGERPRPERPTLEVRAERDREAHAGLERDDLLARPLTPPHLAAATEDVPDLLDRPV